ncbi:MAG: hypothetical protein WC627_06380 [Legionella sp.]|jgi:hypothetical protein
MKLQHILLAVSLITTSNFALAQDASELQAQREQVMHQYILDLGRADYADITKLFNEGGTVISTSRGTVNAQEFFYGFLSEVETAKTDVHQTFVSLEDKDHYGARFRFTFTLKDGEVGDGEYVDEFIFAKDSAKLNQVYMFENLKFN